MQATYDGMLPPPEANESSHGFRLRRHYQFLTLAFCLKKKPFLRRNELKETAINFKT